MVYLLGGFPIVSQLLEPKEEEPAPRQLVEPVTLSLNPVGEAREIGTVLFEDTGEGMRVLLRFQGAPEDVFQPVSMREGSCLAPGSVLYKLNDALNGRSETVLGVPVDDIRNAARESGLIVQVAESQEEPGEAVACAQT